MDCDPKCPEDVLKFGNDIEERPIKSPKDFVPAKSL